MDRLFAVAFMNMTRINDREFVRDIIRRLQDNQIAVCLFGGWAEELCGLSQPRTHVDVDLLYPATDFRELDSFFRRNEDWKEITLKRFPHKRAATVGGIMVEFVLVQKSDRGCFTFFFNTYRFDWPEDTFDKTIRLPESDVQIASRTALEKYRGDHHAIRKACNDYMGAVDQAAASVIRTRGKMLIRPGTPEDLEPVMSLIWRCILHMESREIHQWDEIYPDRLTVENNIQSGALYVGEAAGRCCASFAIDQEQPLEYGQIRWSCTSGSVLVVHRLCVDPIDQGGGVAQLLMEFAERYTGDNDYDAIRLDAFTKNPTAVHLYESRGYRKAGTVIFRKGPFYCFEKWIRSPNEMIRPSIDEDGKKIRRPIRRIGEK